MGQAEWGKLACDRPHFAQRWMQAMAPTRSLSCRPAPPSLAAGRPDRQRWRPFPALSGGQQALATLALCFALQVRLRRLLWGCFCSSPQHHALIAWAALGP